MGEFEVLSHTADVGFRARGESLADLFETAARAMFSLEYDPATVPLEREVEVRAEGGDPEAALYGWLSELIWLHDAEGFVPMAPPREPLSEEELMPRGQEFLTVGHLYRGIEDGLRTLTERLVARRAASVPLPQVHLVHYGECLAPHSTVRAIITTPR